MGGGWTNDPNRARYGCFLPDLTGLASDLPTANLPPSISGIWLAEARVGMLQVRLLSPQTRIVVSSRSPAS